MRPTKYYEIEDQIAAVVADLELYTYYQLLDVEPGADASIVEFNYQTKTYEYEQLQKDRWCGPILHQHLELLKARLGEAREVLCDAALQAEYDRGLDEGATRHAATVARREGPQKPKRPARPDAVAEMAAQLERRLHKSLLHAKEEIPDEPSEGIDQELVDQIAIDLEDQVQQLGVELAVKDEPEAPVAPIDAGYLEQASEHLVGRLYAEHKVTLHEQTEADDQSADASYAGDITESLRGELYKMGVSEWEQTEAEGIAPDAETLDRLLGQEQRALDELGVSTQVQRDEGLHERTVDRATVERLAAELEQKLHAGGVGYQAAERERSVLEGTDAIELEPLLPAVEPLPGDLPLARSATGPQRPAAPLPPARRVTGPHAPALRELASSPGARIAEEQPFDEVIGLELEGDTAPGASAPVASAAGGGPRRIHSDGGERPGASSGRSRDGDEEIVPLIPLDDPEPPRRR